MRRSRVRQTRSISRGNVLSIDEADAFENDLATLLIFDENLEGTAKREAEKWPALKWEDTPEADVQDEAIPAKLREATRYSLALRRNAKVKHQDDIGKGLIRSRVRKPAGTSRGSLDQTG